MKWVYLGSRFKGTVYHGKKGIAVDFRLWLRRVTLCLHSWTESNEWSGRCYLGIHSRTQAHEMVGQHSVFDFFSYLIKSTLEMRWDTYLEMSFQSSWWWRLASKYIVLQLILSICFVLFFREHLIIYLFGKSGDVFNLFY